MKQVNRPDVRLSRICADRDGAWYAIGTRKQWVEIRITPSGLIRVFGVKKGKHPYFTPMEGEKL